MKKSISDNQLPLSIFSLLDQLDKEGITGVQRYNKVKKYIQFKARETATPVCGTFELTPFCNLSCKMCYVHLEKEQLKGRSLLSVNTWKSFIDQAIDAGLMYAAVTGGECLTYPGFKELYMYFRSRGIETTILSNGVLMTEDMVSFLAVNPPAGVQITLYGCDDDEYERVTGHRSFQKVMDGINRVKAANIPLTIAITPNKFMRKGRELIHLLYDLGLPFSINSGLKMPREETGRGLLDASLDTYVELYRENNRLGGGLPWESVPDEDLPDPGPTSEILKPGQKCGVRCAAGRSSFFITWDGKMKPCNSFPGIEEEILTIGFEKAWLRINNAIQRIMLPAECHDCQYAEACKHCIIDHLYSEDPSHANTMVCDYVRRFVKEGIIKLKE